jgi:DNA-binding NarL/FixJ family response regulator
MIPKTLTPFQERLCCLRLAGKSLLEIALELKRNYGTTRNDFQRIYKIFGIRLTCQLPEAWATYESEKVAHLKKSQELLNDK